MLNKALGECITKTGAMLGSTLHRPVILVTPSLGPHLFIFSWETEKGHLIILSFLFLPKDCTFLHFIYFLMVVGLFAIEIAK